MRRQLKARAHKIDPVVMIGAEGLSGGVLAEIDRALKAHELIKVRVSGADREAREALLEEICRSTGAQAVQHIGKILVVFREDPEGPPAMPAPRGYARRPAGAARAAPVETRAKPGARALRTRPSRRASFAGKPRRGRLRPR